MSKINVITGERGSGKSNYCKKLLESAKKDGIKVSGFIAPAIYENGIKTGFTTLNADTLEQRPCGKRVAENGTIGCWRMDPAVIAWGNELLRCACPCEVLFIDELGPLEFRNHAGYTAAFDVLREGNYKTAYVVIRPDCLEHFRKQFPDFDLITIGEAHVPLD